MGLEQYSKIVKQICLYQLTVKITCHFLFDLEKMFLISQPFLCFLSTLQFPFNNNNKQNMKCFQAPSDCMSIRKVLLYINAHRYKLSKLCSRQVVLLSSQHSMGWPTGHRYSLRLIMCPFHCIYYIFILFISLYCVTFQPWRESYWDSGSRAETHGICLPNVKHGLCVEGKLQAVTIFKQTHRQS